MPDESSSGSSTNCQSDADRALSDMKPKMAEFTRRFSAGMQAKETGYTRFEVRYARGRVTAIIVASQEEIDPRS